MDRDQIIKWNRIRWITTGIYIFITLLITGSMLLISEYEGLLGITLSIWVVGALLPLFFILAFPWIKNRKVCSITENDLTREIIKIREPAIKEINDSVPFLWVFLMIILTMVVIQIVISIIPIINGDTLMIEMIISNAATIIFIALIAVLFHRLDLEVDNERVYFHWGPSGKKLSIDQIEDIRPVSVHALRDFMGFGIKHGSDGSTGYISNSRFGVRITTKEGRTYTVSTNKPMEVSELVRWLGNEVTESDLNKVMK